MFKQDFSYANHTRAKIVKKVHPEVGLWDEQWRRAGHRKLVACKSGV